MKRIWNLLLTTLLLIFCAAPASAQFRFGVKAGLNLATIAPSSDLDKFYEEDYVGTGFNAKMIPSFHVGVLGEYDFSSKLGLGLGLQLTGKGYRFDESFDDVRYKEKITPLYLQIPLTFNFHTKGFFAAIGPYLAFGIAGKYEATYEENGDAETLDGKLSFDNAFNEDGDVLAENVGPTDLGAGLELGYEFHGHFRVSASYSVGLTNIYSKKLVELAKEEGDIANFKATHRVIGLSATYLFGSRAE
ncbi:MAG: porin family protein [Saprospiraceae bacterium]